MANSFLLVCFSKCKGRYKLRALHVANASELRRGWASAWSAWFWEISETGSKEPELITVLYPNVGVPTGREVDGFPGIAPNAEGITPVRLGELHRVRFRRRIVFGWICEKWIRIGPRGRRIRESEKKRARVSGERWCPLGRAKKSSGLRVDGQSNAPKFAGTGMMSTMPDYRIPDQTNPNWPAARLLWLETPRTTKQSCTGLEKTAV